MQINSQQNVIRKVSPLVVDLESSRGPTSSNLTPLEYELVEVAISEGSENDVNDIELVLDISEQTPCSMSQLSDYFQLEDNINSTEIDPSQSEFNIFGIFKDEKLEMKEVQCLSQVDTGSHSEKPLYSQISNGTESQQSENIDSGLEWNIPNNQDIDFEEFTNLQESNREEYLQSMHSQVKDFKNIEMTLEFLQSKYQKQNWRLKHKTYTPK